MSIIESAFASDGKKASASKRYVELLRESVAGIQHSAKEQEEFREIVQILDKSETAVRKDESFLSEIYLAISSAAGATKAKRLEEEAYDRLVRANDDAKAANLAALQSIKQASDAYDEAHEQKNLVANAAAKVFTMTPARPDLVDETTLAFFKAQISQD